MQTGRGRSVYLRSRDRNPAASRIADRACPHLCGPGRDRDRECAAVRRGAGEDARSDGIAATADCNVGSSAGHQRARRANLQPVFKTMLENATRDLRCKLRHDEFYVTVTVRHRRALQRATGLRRTVRGHADPATPAGATRHRCRSQASGSRSRHRKSCRCTRAANPCVVATGRSRAARERRSSCRCCREDE